MKKKLFLLIFLILSAILFGGVQSMRQAKKALRAG